MESIYIALALGALAGALATFDAWAQSATRNGGGPFDLALLTTYAWVFLISMLGGVASFWRKVKSGQARWFNFAELVGELFISAFAGLLTFFVASWARLDMWMIAALSGISGHMGSRALFLLERVFERWADRIFGPDTSPGAPRLPMRGTPGDEA
jgi:hypothetical protein